MKVSTHLHLNNQVQDYCKFKIILITSIIRLFITIQLKHDNKFVGFGGSIRFGLRKTKDLGKYIPIANLS